MHPILTDLDAQLRHQELLRAAADRQRVVASRRRSPRRRRPGAVARWLAGARERPLRPATTATTDRYTPLTPS